MMPRWTSEMDFRGTVKDTVGRLERSDEVGRGSQKENRGNKERKKGRRMRSMMADWIDSMYYYGPSITQITPP